MLVSLSPSRPVLGLALPSGQIKVARLLTAETGQRAFVLARSGDKRSKELPNNFHLKNLENAVRLTRPTQLPPRTENCQLKSCAQGRLEGLPLPSVET